MTLDILTSDLLAGTRHGFFARRGGASSGIYAGLNCGPGSADQREAVALNRARVADALGVAAAAPPLAPPGPRHRRGHAPAWTGGPRDRAPTRPSPTCRAWRSASSPPTARPVLFHDPDARVIGAAHAGWRGALDGVIEATLAAMGRLGARTASVRAVVGPTISQRAYEVGPEFLDRFRAEEHGLERYFAPGQGDRLHFDLPGFVLARLRAAGVAEAAWVGACTFSDPDRFFSTAAPPTRASRTTDAPLSHPLQLYALRRPRPRERQAHSAVDAQRPSFPFAAAET